VAEENLDELIKAASKECGDTDIILYAGQIRRPYDDEFINNCGRMLRRQKILLMLTTTGGEADAAYRIARCLQRSYNTGAYAPDSKDKEAPPQGKFILYVDTLCASAGTLLALGADELIISDYGELGPLDVQLRKPDEVGERHSGLTPQQALDSLDRHSRSLFKSHFRQLRFDPDLTLTTKTSVEIAATITKGLLEPIYSQIDPMRLGEVERFLGIAEKYGERLGTTNLKDGTPERLIAGYPSHTFVIDRKEARDLFKNVSRPKKDLIKLAEFLRPMCENKVNSWYPFRSFLTDPPAAKTQETRRGKKNGRKKDTGKS